MAFSPRSLVRQSLQAPIGAVSGAVRSGQVSHFIYTTDDAAAVVEAAAYFNAARLTLNVGDTIIAAMAMGGTPISKQYIVTAAPKVTGNVVIALQTTTAG